MKRAEGALEAVLPAASEGVPAVYEVEGREIHRCLCSFGERDGDTEGRTQEPTGQPVHRSYIAFALPKAPN